MTNSLNTKDINHFSNFSGYTPVTISNPELYGNQLTQTQFRVAAQYATPEHLEFAAAPGPFMPAGVYEVNSQYFLQQRPKIFSNNLQIVTVPERPIDAGTALAGINSGVYNQKRVIGISHSAYGSAPTTGIYSGFSSDEGEF